jgi:hypothetical protein
MKNGSIFRYDIARSPRKSRNLAHQGSSMKLTEDPEQEKSLMDSALDHWQSFF